MGLGGIGGRKTSRIRVHLCSSLVLSFFTSAAVFAEEQGRTSKSGFERTGQLGGPTSVTAQLGEDDQVTTPVFRFPWFDRTLQPWFDLKGRLNEKYGLQLGLNYTALYQAADTAPDGAEDTAASGVARFFGKWTLLGYDTQNPGQLVFSVDSRHRLGTEIPPSQLGFEVGYLGIPGTLFSDVELELIDLNWQQTIGGGRGGLVIGRLDPNDYMDVLGYANPWTSFQNLAVLFNTSIALSDLGFGAAFGHFLDDQWFVLGVINDANAYIEDIDFYADGAEFYVQGELGWTPSKDQRYFKNVHVTGWHTDERDHAGVEESWGFTAAGNWTFGEVLMPFARAGWSEGLAPLMNKTATLGAMYFLSRRSDLVGLGLNWGDPSDDSLRDQYTGELFYRIQFAQNLAITPSFQYLGRPSLNPAEDEIWIGSIRARLTF